ncbi:MAG: NUDIX domain-containing protein [Candidatus Hodarchaeales archaeon]
MGIDKVHWKYDRLKKFEFSETVKKLCQKNWQTMIKRFPKIYDGTLLVLDDYWINDGELQLRLRNMRFSELIYHVEERMRLPESLGPLGFQTFVVNRERTHFLIGKRSLASEYMPGSLTIPGGMFEEEDAGKSVTAACLRELQEELELYVDESSFRAIALLREKNDIGSILLTEVMIAEIVSLDTRRGIKGNEEWEGNELQWLSFSDIDTLVGCSLMEGLMYLENTGRYLL